VSRARSDGDALASAARRADAALTVARAAAFYYAARARGCALDGDSEAIVRSAAANTRAEADYNRAWADDADARRALACARGGAQ